ncbi:MAG: hypothetical protein LKG27_08125 [Clostridiaceae bacterium]|nr:hypothetical protein [Clostridiaceae bacterium]
MKIFKILLSKFSTNQKQIQNSVAPELFNSMINTCKTRREQKALYKLANSLPKDIYISAIGEHKDQIFYESPNMSIAALKKLIKSLCGTFVTYTQKSDPKNIIQKKISDEILFPPDKETMTAIADTFSIHKV